MPFPVIVHSNAPFAATGYGQQCALLAPRLAQAGHHTGVSAFYGLNGALLVWNGLPVYPGGYTSYGVDVLPGHAATHFGGNLQNGVIVTLVDAWVLEPNSMSRANHLAWTPVDHEPCPRHVLDFFHTSGSTPVAMTRNGEQLLKDGGLEPLYAPHMVDTQTFYPEAGRMECRRALGLPEGAFIVGMVAANKGYPSRKGFSQALEAFKAFSETHDDAILYLHTEMEGHIQGVNIGSLIEANGIPREKVVACDPYRYLLSFPGEYMRQMYNSLDVLLNPSYGEGFGIPQVEANACGTPVIATDWTAMREVSHGWKVQGQRVFTDQRSFQMVPDIGELVFCLDEAYENAAGMRDDAHAHAQKYDADLVMAEHWLPVLAEFGAGCGLGEPVSAVA